MNNKLEMMWKEVAMGQFEILSHNYSSRTEENHEESGS
jgi:hypothetical protein